MNFVRRVFLISITILVFASLPAVAQQTALTGTVKDASGAVIPGATVTLTHKGTGATRTASTRADGSYIVPALQPGAYRIEITMDGFRTSVTDPITVAVGFTSTFNATMEVGQVTEEVIVESDTAAINTVDASMGTAISGAEVGRLPSADLNPAGLLSLQAGVTFVPGDTELAGGYGGISDFDGRGGSVNGARSDQSNITLDGIDVNDPQNGYAFTATLRTTQASLQEFRVSTTNYNADSGRSSGAQVQLITKSGTNDLHGDLYYLHRNEAFGANDFFLNRSGEDKPKLRRHVYGAALGGPVVKDRFFLFGNWERLEEALAPATLRDVPSESFRDGVFIYECQDGGAVNCPTAPTQVMGDTTLWDIPAGSYGLSPAEMAALDPIGIGASPELLAHMQGYETPNDFGGFDGVNIVGFRFAAPLTNEFNTYILKADFNIDTEGKHRLFWRGTLQNDTNQTSSQFPGLPNRQTIRDGSKGFALGYTATLSSSLVSNFRWGLTRIKETTVGQQTQPFVSIRFLDNLEDYSSNSFGRTLPINHISEDLSWIRGAHTLSFGGQMRTTRNDRFTNANSWPGLTSNPSWLPNGGRALLPEHGDCVAVGCDQVPLVSDNSIQSYIDGMVNLFGVISDGTARYNYDRAGNTLPEGDLVSRKFAVDEFDLYVQDQWRATPELTLTFGVRYSQATPPWETSGTQVAPRVVDGSGNVIPDSSISEWFEERRSLMEQGLRTGDAGDLGFILSGKVNGEKGFYDKDTDNFAPRIAAAWSPKIDNAFFGNGKMVIRGGYSLVYDRIGPALAASFDSGGSFGLSSNIDAAFGGCSVGDPTEFTGICSRFTDVFNVAGVQDSGPDGLFNTPDDLDHLFANPGGGFPAIPPPDLTLINEAMDDSITTPFSHTINISVQRELPADLTLEVAYVGRRGRDLLMVRDMGQPADIRDPISGMSLYEASAELVRLGQLVETGVMLFTEVPDVAFFDNMLPGLGPTGVNGGDISNAGWYGDTFGAVPDGADGIPGTADDGTGLGFTATQVALNATIADHGTPSAGSGFGITSTWLGFDACAAACITDANGVEDFYSIFTSQYGDIQVWSSIAKADYDALQVIVRRRMKDGLLFNINYTLSQSKDHSSSPERGDTFAPFEVGGYSGSTINAWDLDQEFALSDFDMTHQFNASWVAELPFARDAEGWAKHIIGDWELSGITRVNTGLPASVVNGRTWPTNWDLQGNATCAPAGAYKFGVDTGPCPATQNTHNANGDRGPNLFQDPDAAFDQFRFTLPGDRGPRNHLRADGFFTLDLSLRKNFSLPMEGHSLAFAWDIFNVTNSVFFDAVSLEASVGRQGSFGNYTEIMGTPRTMQLSLRYQF